MSLKSIIRNLTKRGLKDVTNPERRKMYFTGEKIKKEGLHLSYKEILPYMEQLLFRTVVCNPCLKNGSCFKCGCTMPSAMMTPQFECEEGKFIPMFTKMVEVKDGKGEVVEREFVNSDRDWETSV